MLVVVRADVSFVFGVARVGLVAEGAGECAQSRASGFGLEAEWRRW